MTEERIAGELVPSWASESDREAMHSAADRGRAVGFASGLRIVAGFGVILGFVVTLLLMLSTGAHGQPGRSPSPGFGTPDWSNLPHPTLWSGIYDPEHPQPPVDLSPSSWSASAVIVPPLPGLVGPAPLVVCRR